MDSNAINIDSLTDQSTSMAIQFASKYVIRVLTSYNKPYGSELSKKYVLTFENR